ncbi:MAG: tRNA pseudouridine(55) synthase TruB [Candidatus Altimarinota bacterium]
MINGFLLIDKEKGINSFKLVLGLRRALGQKKVGFAGTLDPLASGLMIMGLGEYTKLLPYLEISDKVYTVTAELGAVSNTYDGEGEIIRKKVEQPSLELIEKTLQENFVGKIEQVPPIFSAIQIDGQRAYDLARKGRDFQLKARPVEIFSINIVKYEFPLLTLKVHCSSGTYIRSLAADLGEKLNTGAYVQDLRRDSISKTSVEDLKVIDSGKLEKEIVLANILDATTLLPDWQKIELKDDDYRTLSLGNFIEDKWQVKEKALAIWRGQTVGVVEFVDNSDKLKFLRKFNIVEATF